MSDNDLKGMCYTQFMTPERCGPWCDGACKKYRKPKPAKDKTYTEAELQEKLRQQRESCAMAWINHGSLYDCADVIRAATIDNNGEE